MLVQLLAAGVAIYLGFTGRLLAGIFLGVLTGAAHFVLFRLSEYLMRSHQQRMPSADQSELEMRALVGAAEPPAAWRRIATICGAGYVLLMLVLIYAFAR